MSKYTKKPVTIEAFKLGVDYIPDWFMDKVSTNEIILKGTSSGFIHNDDINADINTLEGVMHANFGDYIIKGVKGEIYPCKPDIFEATYEKELTIEEVKEEWEELGYEFVRNCDFIELINKEKEELFIIDTKHKKYAKTDDKVKFTLYIFFQEHQLLTKTFRALGWEL